MRIYTFAATTGIVCLAAISLVMPAAAAAGPVTGDTLSFFERNPNGNTALSVLNLPDAGMSGHGQAEFGGTSPGLFPGSVMVNGGFIPLFRWEPASERRGLIGPTTGLRRLPGASEMSGDDSGDYQLDDGAAATSAESDSTNPIPEPATLALVGGGAALLAGVRRRQALRTAGK
jgi:hypothetical protein